MKAKLAAAWIALITLCLASTAAAQGCPASALSFDGVDDFAVVPAHPDFDFGLGDAFTVELWMKRDAPPVAPAQESLIEQWNGSCGAPYPFTIRLDGNGHIRCAGFDATNCSSVAGLLTSTPLNVANGKWHHVAYQRDSVGISTLWIDGILMGTSFIPPLASTANGLPLYIGRRGPPTGFANYYGGMLDEIRVSRSVRYSAPFVPSTQLASDASTVLLLSLDESGQFAVDRGPGSHDAILGTTLGPDAEDPARVGSTLPVPYGLVTSVNGGAADDSHKILHGSDLLGFELDAACLPGFAGMPASIAINIGPDALVPGSTLGLPDFEVVSTISSPAGLAFWAGNGGAMSALGLGFDLGLGPYFIGSGALTLPMPPYLGPPLPIRLQAIYFAADRQGIPVGASNPVTAELRP